MTTATHTPGGVSFTLNDQPLTAASDETILQAARRNGVDIPHLCYADGLATAGNCRACVVEIEGERVLAPSCCRAPTEGMKVSSDNERARRSQSLVLELLRARSVMRAIHRSQSLITGASAMNSSAAASVDAANPWRMSRIRLSQSTSKAASSAPGVSAPAVRSK